MRGEGGADAVVVGGEAGAGEVAFDFGEEIDAGGDGGRVDADVSRHGGEDAMDFGLLVFEQLDEGVVLLDGFEGLDVDGLAGGACSVDDARDAALEFRFDGDDEALAANGDKVLLRCSFLAEASQGCAKAVFDVALLALHLAADAAQVGGSVVAEGAIGFDLSGEGGEQRREVLLTQRRGESFDGGPVAVERGRRREQQIAPGFEAFDDDEQRQDFSGFECCAFDAGLVEQRRGVEEAVEFDGAAGGDKETDFGGALVLLIEPGAVYAGLEREHPCAAEGRTCVACDGFAQARPFERGGAGFAQRRWDGGQQAH